YQGFLNHESVTVGEVLKQAGYSTLMVGKWHVGQDSIGWPNQRGFDKFYGFVGGASNYYDIGSYPEKAPKVPLIKNNKRFNLAPGKYLTEEITNNALEFLTDQNKENKPFFLYMAYNAPHWPLQALPEDIAKYKGKYSIGWDSLRTLRLQKQIQLGIRDPKQKIADRDSEVPYWASLTYDEQQLWQHKMEVYAAMVDRVDQGIGRVLAKLKELKKDENTLIVFISDNGAQGGYVNTAKRKAQRNSGPIGTAGSYDYQEQSWAYVSNTPFRSYKAMAYEGGISAPFIAWYPKGIKANSIAQGTAHLIDLAPTFYELAGAKYPSVYQGNTINPLAGKSLTNVLFEGKDLNRETPLFWERAGNRAVRKGNWKLVSIYPDKKWQLFDLASDRGETTNVADTNPEIVKELSAAYVAWAKKNDVVDYDSIKPTGNQGFAGPPAAAQRTRSSERD
ncbi:MAG: sulfatase, partial [Daejeonella sp.]|nr:sulfatase [Daejeonella sp.]